MCVCLDTFIVAQVVAEKFTCDYIILNYLNSDYRVESSPDHDYEYARIRNKNTVSSYVSLN
jgi:hypothetical protein